MEYGILQVLLVNAKGIRRTNLFGNPSYYVLIQCGNEVRRSKTTKGYRHKAFWNQKFEFEFPFSEWKNLTHLEISIMDDESFNDTGFIGRAIIFVGGLVVEMNNRGFIEVHPSPYNVVLEDTTYKGQIKIGLKFKRKVHKEIRKQTVVQIVETKHNFYSRLFRILKVSWWRALFPCNQF